MAHGGYGKRRVAERKPPVGRRSKGLGVDKKPKQKPKSVSLKNQIRSVERMQGTSTSSKRSSRKEARGIEQATRNSYSFGS
ncbi:hypothetical protein OIU78_007273 [Salix suchowensis]|nr:hypothetical protein OIU78_007273 [Salix suchowensis]